MKWLPPLFELVNYIVTFFEGDKVPLSYASVSFLLIYESLDIFDLDLDVKKTAREARHHRFWTIRSDVNWLAVVLDPMVPKSRLFSLVMEFPEINFTFGSRRSF